MNTVPRHQREKYLSFLPVSVPEMSHDLTPCIFRLSHPLRLIDSPVDHSTVNRGQSDFGAAVSGPFRRGIR